MLDLGLAYIISVFNKKCIMLEGAKYYWLPKLRKVKENLLLVPFRTKQGDNHRHGYGGKKKKNI